MWLDFQAELEGILLKKYKQASINSGQIFFFVFVPITFYFFFLGFKSIVIINYEDL